MPRSDYYIPIFDELPGHKKERGLRKAMDWNGFESVGFLVWFWLQVAADFPNGELPGLDELKATLREVWKAAGIEVKRNRIQLVAEKLLAGGLVDSSESSGRLLMHDWEDGAGMFAMKRLYEREKKRRQREAERQRPPGSVPGTGGDCPPDVPGEKEKGKRKETPPNPPQAGGEFADFQELVLNTWREECARVPVDAVEDNKTTRGVASFAKQLMQDKITPDQARAAIRGFLAVKYSSDPKEAASAKTWNLYTCSERPSTFFPKGGAAAVAPAGKPAVMGYWRATCDVCGAQSGLIPQRMGDAAPEPNPCVRGMIPGRECAGTMRPELVEV